MLPLVEEGRGKNAGEKSSLTTLQFSAVSSFLKLQIQLELSVQGVLQE